MKRAKKKVPKKIQEMLTKDLNRLSSVVQEIKQMVSIVANLPEEAEFSLEDLDTLEEARKQSLRLAHECESFFEVFQGG